ncbi:unnamed protein product [Staurois parvus]|uniref:MHC class I antigen n=1 Tax=Staurois parvus TaxID=386267 RepID=A0ABN9BNV3_9NEOB|nr:unnamed protein product [Staurois parvus]
MARDGHYMTRDCRHSTGGPETADIVQEMTRDCRPLGSKYPNRQSSGTGPRRLRGHSQSAALLAHAQWVPSCEAASW